MTGCHQRIERMVAVEREYQAAVVAATLLFENLQNNPSYLDAHDLRYRDAVRWRSGLGATYLIRLFAEFEAGLRDAWRNAFRRKSRPGMETLLRAVATIRAIPQDDVDATDTVRRYRNALVHEGALGDVQAVTLRRSRSGLCRYFKRLPMSW